MEIVVLDITTIWPQCSHYERFDLKRTQNMVPRTMLEDDEAGHRKLEILFIWKSSVKLGGG